MNTKPRSPIVLLLLGTFLLAWAGTAKARDISVDFVTVLISQLNVPTPLGPGDTITVQNNGTLLVDTSATIGMLNIGSATTIGTVTFPGTFTLTVASNVTFGASSVLNTLDMSVSLTTPVLKVGGNFIQSGAGRFFAGSGTVEYNGTNAAQTVSANVGGTATPIQYKNVILSGIPAAGNANKNFAPGVSIQGTLTVSEKAVPAGPSATYGSLAQLVYNSASAQTSSATEWPASMSVPVTINNTAGLTLDGDKTIANAFPNSLALGSGTVLKDNGKTLTIQGNMTSDGSIQGTGKLVLSGSSAQALAGSGNYGNVTVNNAAGVSLSGNNPTTQPTINGRLSITTGKLKLPNGTTHQASLLTYLNADRAASTYGATTSTATTQNDAVFDSTGAGVLTLNPKPAGVLASAGAPPSMTYGTSNAVVSGTVAAPATTPNFATYGNGPQDNETVTITIGSVPPIVTNATVVNGAFTATLNTAALSIQGSPYSIRFDYLGGNNLAASTLLNAASLSVLAKPILIIPQSVAKTYGQPDPPLTNGLTFSPPDALVGSDYLTGTITRQVGENVGPYTITKGTLIVTNNTIPNVANNYDLTFDGTKRLTIVQKPITVTINSTNKNYGDTNDPAFTYTSTPLAFGDTFSGAPTRTPSPSPSGAGQNVGVYPITQGTLQPGVNPANYSMTVTPGATLTINPTNVTISFNSTSKAFGAADPVFQFTVTSPPIFPGNNPALFFGNTLTGVATRVSGPTVAGSPYIILPGTLKFGTNTPNYITNYTTTGTLTITNRAVTVGAKTFNKLYGAAMPNNWGTNVTGSLPLVSYTNLLNSPPQPVTPNTITWGVGGTPIQCSVPGAYPFTIANDAADPNHTIAAASPSAGTLTIVKSNLTIMADNKTKVANNTLFDKSGFTVTYNQLVCGDVPAPSASFSGLLDYTGSALVAVDPGVYEIMPTGLTSTKYNIANALGYLAITASPATNTVNQNVTWDIGGSASFMINNPNGLPGKDPGWSLLKVNGTLIINATEASKFRLDVVSMAGNQAGRMPKFDPTRPYSWEFVQARDGISGFVTNTQFSCNSAGLFLFANPVYGGTFTVRKNGNSLFLDFTPVGTSRNLAEGSGALSPGIVPGSYTVGTLANPLTLLGDVTSGDLDTIFLQATNINNIPPTAPTVGLTINVANLKQPIVGVDAYINFDSRFFNASTNRDANGFPVAGAPVVQRGDGVWDTVILQSWNVGGDLDTVLAVTLQNTLGTTANSIVGRVILTPTKTATGTNRVVFRVDGTPLADGSTNPPVHTDLVPLDPLLPAVLPARVMTDPIILTFDNGRPLVTSVTATQAQPHVSTPQNVKNGTAGGNGGSSGTLVVKTSGSGATASGPVFIAIAANDPGVGLSGPPVVSLTNGSSFAILTCTNPVQTSGTFGYLWNVTNGTAPGTWNASYTASDTISPVPNTTNAVNAFTLVVNTNEVNGVVEVDSFIGTNRTVTFKAGGPTAKTWGVPLNFTSGLLPNAGAFQNRGTVAARLITPPDPLFTYLRYGSILDLPALAFRLSNQVGGVSTYIYGLEYGTIADLTVLAGQLQNPTRSIDSYVRGLLPLTTKVLLAAYQTNAAANAAALTTALLNDFNNIVLGPSIYDPVRFAGVCQNHPTSGPDTVVVNRGLLEDAYVLVCGGEGDPYVSNYEPGQLSAQTAQMLSQYAGGANSALASALLADFDQLTSDSDLWPTPETVPYDQGLYNQTIFLGVTLSSNSVALLQTFPSGSQLTLLNQSVLQDAYAGQFEKPPVTPATVVTAQDFNASVPATVQAFDSAMVTDLNALINRGTTIMDVPPANYLNSARFAPWVGGIDPSGELGLLLLSASPLSPAQLLRENRLLLELGFNGSQDSSAVLSTSFLGLYRLVQVPNNTTNISAKTAWNLRVNEPVILAVGAANFVNDGVPGFSGATDFYLRAGDVTTDNVVNLGDYNVLKAVFGQTGAGGAQADLNGDSRVNINDYNLMKVNFSKTGDPEISN